MAIPCPTVPTVPHINLQTMHRFLDDDIFAPLADLLGHDDPSGKEAPLSPPRVPPRGTKSCFEIIAILDFPPP